MYSKSNNIPCVAYLTIFCWTIKSNATKINDKRIKNINNGWYPLSYCSRLAWTNLCNIMLLRNIYFPANK